MPRVTASEASRNFASVIGRAAAGEEFEVTRSGQTIASIGPPRVTTIPAERFRELMRSAPPVDEAFEEDLRRIRERQGPAPEPPPWPS
jgi:antitoxin (DNA-binding transcriptional repressor) of toxin-antitoxin stability system